MQGNLAAAKSIPAAPATPKRKHKIESPPAQKDSCLI